MKGRAECSIKNQIRRPPIFRMARVLSRAAVPLLLTIMGTLLGFLCLKGLPTFGSELLFGDTPALEAITGSRPVWEGLWPAIMGTLCLVGLTLCFALVPGIGLGVFLAEYAGRRVRSMAGAAVDVLAGTPSIVMGLFGFTLILLLRDSLAPNANTCLLLAAACLGLLVLPVLVVSTREALEAVPEDLRLTAAALGFTPAQRLRHVLLPFASRGIWSGVILALGRAAEDTAVILLTGVVANAGLPAGLSEKFEALPFAVYYVTAEYQNQEELMRGFGASLVLLLLAGGMVMLARVVEARYRKRWQGGAA